VNGRRCVILVADGARPDVLERLLVLGKLPNLSSILALGGSYNRAVTVFPSTSGPAYLPMITGKHPGDCNIPGIRWFERSNGQGMPIQGKLRSYVGLGSRFLRSDLSAHTQTLFEISPGSVAIASALAGNYNTKTLSRYELLFMFAHLTGHYYILDKLASYDIVNAVESAAPVVFGILHAIDGYSHKHSPEASVTHDSYVALDRLLGIIVDRLRRKRQEYMLIVTSDHGLTATTRHLDLAEILSSFGCTVYAFPSVLGEWNPKAFEYDNLLSSVDCICAVSGNSMANIYFRNGISWEGITYCENLQQVIAGLLANPGVDIVAGRSLSGGIRVFSRRGQSSMEFDGTNVIYSAIERDPFGYKNMPIGIPIDLAFPFTYDTDYPDAPLQLFHLLQSARAGDLVASATEGFDFRTNEFPLHHSSHGSLCRAHMLVPLVSTSSIRSKYVRTVDIFPTILEYMGIPSDKLELQGRSFLGDGIAPFRS